jgi:hypothetical protein
MLLGLDSGKIALKTTQRENKINGLTDSRNAAADC